MHTDGHRLSPSLLRASDRRISPRFPCGWEVAVRSPDAAAGPARAWLLDLSSWGGQVSFEPTGEPPKVDEILTIHLGGSRAPWGEEMTGKVVWSSRGDNPRAGLRLISMTPGASERMGRIFREAEAAEALQPGDPPDLEIS